MPGLSAHEQTILDLVRRGMANGDGISSKSVFPTSTYRETPT